MRSKRRVWAASVVGAASLLCLRCSLAYDVDALGSAPARDEAGSVVDAGPSADVVADVRRDVVIPDAASSCITGHHYLVVPRANLTWQRARDLAEEMGGYLATITSPEENNCVNALVRRMGGDASRNGQGPWLGGVQPDGSTEPAGGWTWVTGEPWDFTAWAPNEPSDDPPGEPVLNMRPTLSGGKTWNDLPSSFELEGFVVEFD